VDIIAHHLVYIVLSVFSTADKSVSIVANWTLALFSQCLMFSWGFTWVNYWEHWTDAVDPRHWFTRQSWVRRVMWVLCSLPTSPDLTYYQSDIFNVCRCVTFGTIKLSNGHGVRLCVARLMCDMSALLVHGLT